MRVEEAATVRVARDEVAALYLDYARWPLLFPATIRGVRLLRQDGETTTVEVEHRTAGRVVNVLRRRSPSEIELWESKPRYEATFVNRFEPVPEGTRYAVVADVRPRMPYALLVPVLGFVLRPLVRRSVRRYVLEPMRAYAEGRGSRGSA